MRERGGGGGGGGLGLGRLEQTLEVPDLRLPTQRTGTLIQKSITISYSSFLDSSVRNGLRWHSSFCNRINLEKVSDGKLEIKEKQVFPDEMGGGQWPL